MPRITTAIPLLISVALSACAVQTTDTAVPPIAEIDSQIADAVATTAKADRNVTEIEVASSVPVPMRTENGQRVPEGVVLPPDSVQPVTVDFQGPIEDFLIQMAARAGYVFKKSGPAPANPITISITANEEPLFGVIRRAGNMSDGAADIVFNPTSKSIEIRYDA